ncbi:unnamed protein product [Parnassius apollo]|uniref:(apollo) hypothetical protein n=1 Tax=Parnassius apollo TaxID=110799 RepID=A0A8S3W289_PARAO|nr:unnamed protein product [Parnassius apollo]
MENTILANQSAHWCVSHNVASTGPSNVQQPPNSPKKPAESRPSFRPRTAASASSEPSPQHPVLLLFLPTLLLMGIILLYKTYQCDTTSSEVTATTRALTMIHFSVSYILGVQQE